jgi:probable HAF family extracellular repeat protein
MRYAPGSIRALTLTVILCAGATTAAAQPSFQVMGDFFPAGVSDDGNVVAGTGSDPASGAPGLVIRRWTPTGGLQTAGFVPESEHTTASRISGDGSTILGSDYNARMLIWTAASGIEYPPGTGGSAGGINRDGSVLVGGMNHRPFRWTRSGGAVPLPVPTDWSADGFATAVSADGSVVAGMLFNSPGQRRAFRWTQAGGTALLDQPAGIVASEVNAVSPDGSTVVGRAYDANDVNQPFRWTAAGGFQLLGHLPGFPAEPAPSHVSGAVGATADGSIIIGTESVGPVLGTGSAFIWDAAHGMRDLKSALANDYGMDLSDWTLWTANGITPDGGTIVGLGSNRQFGEAVAWRVVLPEPGAGAPLVASLALLVRRPRRY